MVRLSFFGFDRCDYTVDIFATPFTFAELETPLYQQCECLGLYSTHQLAI